MSKIHLVHLYPVEMNIYGDTGNRLVMAQRLAWRGYQPVIHLVGVGEKLPPQVDFILGGGGQDSGQALVTADLAKKAAQLKSLAADGVPMLMICGLYQLFGHYFLTKEGDKLPGIGLFDLITRGSDTRLIGNITIRTAFGEVVGYENHSGLTELAAGQAAFGQAARGQGNNGQDRTEGATFNNVIGSYLHGPILAKNPALADELIARVLQHASGARPALKPLDDALELAASERAKRRPR